MNILGVKDLGLSSEILGLRVVYMCVCRRMKPFLGHGAGFSFTCDLVVMLMGNHHIAIQNDSKL